MQINDRAKIRTLWHMLLTIVYTANIKSQCRWRKGPILGIIEGDIMHVSTMKNTLSISNKLESIHNQKPQIRIYFFLFQKFIF